VGFWKRSNCFPRHILPINLYIHICPCSRVLGIRKNIGIRTYSGSVTAEIMRGFRHFAFCSVGNRLASFLNVPKNCIFWFASSELIKNLSTLFPKNYKILMQPSYTIVRPNHLGPIFRRLWLNQLDIKFKLNFSKKWIRTRKQLFSEPSGRTAFSFHWQFLCPVLWNRRIFFYVIWSGWYFLQDVSDMFVRVVRQGFGDSGLTCTACWKRLHGAARWRLCVCIVTFFAVVLRFRRTCVYLIDRTRVSM